MMQIRLPTATAPITHSTSGPHPFCTGLASTYPPHAKIRNVQMVVAIVVVVILVIVGVFFIVLVLVVEVPPEVRDDLLECVSLFLVDHTVSDA